MHMIPSYSPQARGRSERNFSTWQGRLPQELRLRGIRTLEGAKSAEGKLLTSLSKKQIKAVEKTWNGKVKKQTFPHHLQIPHTTRDSHFPTTSTATKL